MYIIIVIDGKIEWYMMSYACDYFLSVASFEIVVMDNVYKIERPTCAGLDASCNCIMTLKIY